MKTDLPNRITYEFMNNCDICLVEQEFFDAIPNDVVIVGFQNMNDRTRRVNLQDVSTAVKNLFCRIMILLILSLHMNA